MIRRDREPWVPGVGYVPLRWGKPTKVEEAEDEHQCGDPDCEEAHP